ncbi:hypothetical protein PSP6_30017 [Paraburkholderia tropica]|nr:hypothetical protein PSP6_30017 [Paraburkholderia tropica]
MGARERGAQAWRRVGKKWEREWRGQCGARRKILKERPITSSLLSALRPASAQNAYMRLCVSAFGYTIASFHAGRLAPEYKTGLVIFDVPEIHHFPSAAPRQTDLLGDLSIELIAAHGPRIFF